MKLGRAYYKILQSNNYVYFVFDMWLVVLFFYLKIQSYSAT